MVSMLPKSNVNEVAQNLVYGAMVENAGSPAAGYIRLMRRILELVEATAERARENNRDWNAFLAATPHYTEGEIRNEVRESCNAIAGQWAMEWLLCHLAKHLHDELMYRCEESPVAHVVGAIEYAEDGEVRRSEPRPEAAE
jgi:hypothetical protein